MMSPTDETRRTVHLDMDQLLVVSLLLWSSGLLAEGNHNSTGAQCESTASADIVLLVDGSWSIGRLNFKTVRAFLGRLVSVFNIGPDRVHIGLVQFSGDPKTEWHLNHHETKHSLLEGIFNLPYKGGNTRSGAALAFMLDSVFLPNVGMRANSKKIAVMMTDGKSQDDIIVPSQRLKDAGIEVYVIGVKDADEEELRNIASVPDVIHTYFVNHFKFLPDIIDYLTTNICNSIKSSDSVRLVNGSLCYGRLEVKFNQSNQWWSPVCEADFDQQDAEVVCRELGCGPPSVLQGELYGEVEAPMWTKEFQCGGHESALLDCRSSGSDRNTCSPGEAVGLTCSDPVRLVGGSSRCAGTLELRRQGDWRPVGGSGWTLKEAAVACRELDCGSAVSTRLRNMSLHQPSWEISSECLRSGYTLRECPTTGSSSSIMEITCSDPVRLVGGSHRCAGTLELRRQGDWRPVGGADWTLKEAAVACRELDCGSAVSTRLRNMSLHQPSWEISSECLRSGYTLRECPTTGSSSSIMEITCSDSVRLVNGTLCSGRLEVKFNQSNQSNQFNQSNQWSPVCEADFDQQDAEVVCRELGCGAPSVLQGALYGEVEALMWTKEFQCEGNESALLDCRSSGSERNTCSPGKAVGLTCSDPDGVRLVGGSRRCAGTLELRRQGDWRPVGGAGLTLEEATVFCRKADCGPAVSAGSTRDASNRSAWRINSHCVRSGSALRECVTSLSWSSSVLELTCSGPAAFIIRLVVVPLTLLLFTAVLYFVMKATRGQQPGPQEHIELDYSHLCEQEGAGPAPMAL